MNKQQAEEIILRNTNLIYKCIKDLNVCVSVKSEEEIEEAYYAGLIQLIKNVENYNPDIAKECTYFYKCIKNGILKYFYTSNTQKRKINKLQHLSLEECIFESDDNKTLMETIEDEKVNVEKEVEIKLFVEEVIKKINKMENQKDAKVIKMYYGLDGKPNMTVVEIAKELGVSRSMVGQRLKRGMDKLKIIFEKEKEWKR